MKKIMTLALLLMTIKAFAVQHEFVVDKMENSCAPFDTHTINFRFTDNSVDKNIVVVSIWKWRDNLPQKQFYFSDTGLSIIGSMSLCHLYNNNKKCDIAGGFIVLNKPYKEFKIGDIVEGEMVITKPKVINFKFKYTIPHITHSDSFFCH